ncbi:MAG TPA: phosphopentomutase [Dictyoglomaceae bacterium]|nr:phosphopentomutase [Dictyoglomaceae bacterium]HOL39114.1 phosphopentomutase [Dictyoglomaceae bacterium]HOP94277.1 phosphopentomutase [Dictyoglomaceae bacterium]HPP15268.1 phosphopentomutase [Dictyoglomaceae bacterium]HPU42674.1 phosphopentomutase [Dictyoglomaceae bacterium]
MKKVILIVLDGVGIGELPDAYKYGDEGSNTLANTAKAVGGLKLHNMGKLGISNIYPIMGVPKEEKPLGFFGKMTEASPGKDTTTGHWEISGIILDRPFPIYPNGFPEEIISAFEEAIGRKILGNKPASGTEIIEELGEEHLKTGYPIVYTSADSVFQIAAHEEVIPVQELYKMCEIARQILQGEHAVARVIARPFLGSPGNFYRTPGRKDFSLPPPKKTLLDFLKEADYDVIGIGKIEDVFAGRGITLSFHQKSNDEGVENIIKAWEFLKKGMIFVNLVDFDTLYGHRNDPIGMAKALEDFDNALPNIMALLSGDDLLIITADHGCDPTTPSTDHSREYVPLLIYSPSFKNVFDLGIRSSFTDLGKTLSEYFEVNNDLEGVSFLNKIMQGWKNL